VAHLARYSLVARRWQDALRHAARLRELRQQVDAALIEIAVAFSRGFLDDFRAELMQVADDPAGRSWSLRACMLAELGRTNDAIQMLENGIAEDLRRGRDSEQASRLIALAWLQSTTDPEQALTRARQALRLEGGLAHRLNAGILFTRMGRPGEADGLLGEMERDAETPNGRLACLRLRGELLLARGRSLEALRVLSELDDADGPYAHREYLARTRSRLGDRAGAVAAYLPIARTPEIAWQCPDSTFPGAWADAVREYLQIAGDTADAKIRKLYGRLRPTEHAPR
jgi:tetratricopeptide (TPR) repeat protein